MKVPGRRFVLAGLVAEPREKSVTVVQAHVVKHSVGITSVAGGRVWSDERWDELGVIDEGRRAQFLAAVAELRAGAAACTLPEARGGTTSALDVVACDSCPTGLAAKCAESSGPAFGDRYFAVLDEMLDAASGPQAERVPKAALVQRLFGTLRSLDRMADLVVAYAGLDARNRRSIIVRLNRGDGVRAELYYEEPDRLSWRTLYRDARAVATPNGRLQFLADAPPQANSTMPLSELCLVSRPFWQKS